MDILLILAGALALDLVLGEPPRTIHPVVWMGRVTSFWEKGGIGKSPIAQFVYATVMTLFTIALFAVPTYFLLISLKNMSDVAYLVISAVLFKTTFSLKELRQVALNIKRLLIEKKLEEARFGLRSLVKRDTRHLPEPLLVSATVESVAENTGDSFVAPLFYFLLFGVPGAMAYRVINTLDAKIGYHGQYEYLGKFAARLDSLANFIPARVTALLLVLAAFLLKKDGWASWRVMLSDHAKTESPNAGWSMSAAAGALGVRLEKVGHYQLGQPNVPLVPQTIERALSLMGMSALLWVIISFAAGVSYAVLTS